MADKVKQAIYNKARADKFLLVLSVPDALKGESTKTERRTHHKSREKVMPDTLQFSIYGSVVPEVSVPSTNLPYAGQHMKVSTHAREQYSDITVNFTIDNQFNNYWYIWRWLDILNDSKNSVYDYTENSSAENQAFDKKIRLTDSKIPEALMMHYQTDITIFGLNEFNKNTVQFTYTKAFPVSLGQISYSHRDPSELETSFSFSFSQMLVNLL